MIAAPAGSPTMQEEEVSGTVRERYLDRLTTFRCKAVVRRPQLHGKKTRQPTDLTNQRCTERTLICRLVALADCTERTRGVSSMSWALDHSLKFTRHVLRFRRPPRPLRVRPIHFILVQPTGTMRVWGVVSTTTNRAAGDHLTHAIRAPPLKHTLPSVQG